MLIVIILWGIKIYREFFPENQKNNIEILNSEEWTTTWDTIDNENKVIDTEIPIEKNTAKSIDEMTPEEKQALLSQYKKESKKNNKSETNEKKALIVNSYTTSNNEKTTQNTQSHTEWKPIKEKSFVGKNDNNNPIELEEQAKSNTETFSINEIMNEIDKIEKQEANKNNSNKNNQEKQESSQYLTINEIREKIANELWLYDFNIEYGWFECDWEICTYKFQTEIDNENYVILRDNTKNWKIEKLKDIGIDECLKIAKIDAWFMGNDDDITKWFTNYGYKFTLNTDTQKYIYDMKLDGTIIEKKTPMSEREAGVKVLKYLNLVESANDIFSLNKDVCIYSEKERLFKCDFNYQYKSYWACVDEKSWTLLTAKRNNTWITCSRSWWSKVVITNAYSE